MAFIREHVTLVMQKFNKVMQVVFVCVVADLVCFVLFIQIAGGLL